MNNYGKIIFFDGNPVCHICGKSFKRLMTHVRQSHKISAREYKETFGLNVSKGIISEESRTKSQIAVEKNYGKVVEKNLIKKGEKTRYQNGDEGRTKDKLSHQELMRLKEWAKTNVEPERRKKIGSKLGKSGLGNLKRWGNKNVSTKD